MKPKTVISVCLLLVLIAGFVAFLWPQQPNPWQPASKNYAPDCGADCQVVAKVIPGHKGPALPLLYDPDVDDDVAQWGDCIENIMQCVRANNSFQECVPKQTACPAMCVEKFQAKVKSVNQPKQQRAVFESIFIDDGGLCVPEDREL